MTEWIRAGGTKGIKSVGRMRNLARAQAGVQLKEIDQLVKSLLTGL